MARAPGVSKSIASKSIVSKSILKPARPARRGRIAETVAEVRYGAGEDLGRNRRPDASRLGTVGEVLRRYQVRLRNSVPCAGLDRAAGRGRPQCGSQAAGGRSEGTGGGTG